jgi:hypothetical protein
VKKQKSFSVVNVLFEDKLKLQELKELTGLNEYVLVHRLLSGENKNMIELCLREEK